MKRTKARYRAMCPAAARIRDPQSTLSLVLLRGRLDGPGHPLLHRQTARLGRLKGPRNDMRVHGARPTTSAMGLGRVKTALKGVGFAIQNRLGLRPRSRPSAAWSR